MCYHITVCRSSTRSARERFKRFSLAQRTNSEPIDQMACQSRLERTAPGRSHWPPGTSVKRWSCSNRAWARQRSIPREPALRQVRPRHTIGGGLLYPWTHGSALLRLAVRTVNHRYSLRWLATTTAAQQPIVRGLVQQRGRMPPRARCWRLAESECRHERWVGIKTLVFILHSTS